MRKNWIKACSAVLVATIVLAGCGGKAVEDTNVNAAEYTPEEYVSLAKIQLNEMTDFSATFLGEVQMSPDEAETKTEAIVEFQRDPLLAAFLTKTSFGEEGQTTDIYLEEKADAVSMYMSYEGAWTEMTLPEESAMKSVAIYDARKNMEVLLNAGEEWVRAEGQKSEVVLTGTIPKEKVYTVTEDGAFLQMAGMLGVGENYYTEVEPIPVEVRLKEDGTPLSYHVDFSQVLESVTNCVLQELNGSAEQADTVSVVKYKIAQEISKVGEGVKITIPTEALQDAINYEEEIQLMESSSVAQ